MAHEKGTEIPEALRELISEQYSSFAKDQIYALVDQNTALALDNERLRNESQQRIDLAMLVRRLCRRISKKNCREDDDVVKAALDYLQRKGLRGNLLRTEYTEGAPHVD